MSDILPVQQSARAFASALREMSPLKFVVKKDADAVAAAAIMSKAFQRVALNFSLSFFDDERAAALEPLPEKTLYIGFGDLPGKDFVLDRLADMNLSTLAYCVATVWDEKNSSLVYLALLPYSRNGDAPDYLLQPALAEKVIVTKTGLLSFGSFSQSLHKMLELSVFPFIPEVSGSPDGAISFLRTAGIALNEGSKIRSMEDLSEPELQQMAQLAKVDFVPRTVFLLESDAGQTRDLRELLYLLEICVESDKPSLAFSAALSSNARANALEILREQRRLAIKSFQWFESGVHLEERENFVVLDASAHVPDALAELFVEHVLTSLEASKVLFTIFRTDRGFLVLGAARNTAVDLSKILTQLGTDGPLVKKGAFVHLNLPSSLDKDFVQKLLSCCETSSLEELVQ